MLSPISQYQDNLQQTNLNEKIRELNLFLGLLRQEIATSPQIDWLSVYKNERNLRNVKVDSFISEFGTWPFGMLSYVFNKHLKPNGYSPIHFLIFLTWRRTYDTIDFFAGVWDKNWRVIKEAIDGVLYCLEKGMNFISVDFIFLDKYALYGNSIVIGAIDTTECAQERPKNDNEERLF